MNMGSARWGIVRSGLVCLAHYHPCRLAQRACERQAADPLPPPSPPQCPAPRTGRDARERRDWLACTCGKREQQPVLVVESVIVGQLLTTRDVGALVGAGRGHMAVAKQARASSVR